MLQWIIMAALTAAASLALLVPLYRSRAEAGESDAEMAIYRDQIGELEREVERGVIGRAEAEAARTEIGRRLLKASERAEAKADAGPAGQRRLVATLVALVAVPAIALLVYLQLGAPDTPDQPLAARLGTPELPSDIGAMVAMVEAHLATNPDDGNGWEVVAPVYQGLGRFNEAVRAWANAIRLLGPSAEREAGLGEALALANDGVVTAEANAAFLRALALDPEALKPRFYVAIGLGQEGRNAEAADAWRDLLADAPPDGAPWVAGARRELAKVDPDYVIPQEVPAVPLAEIEAMVQSLAARLQSEPGDAEGWAMLLRSYNVLDRRADAETALAAARSALANDPTKLALVNDAARSIGLAN